jgi:hemolysin III
MTSLERPDDELANAITHGIGFLLTVAASIFLFVRVAHQTLAVIAACSIYAVSLMLVYGASTLSHLFQNTTLRRRFRTLDQACIFLLIAGSYAPFATLFLYEGGWQIVLVVMWMLAVLGAAKVYKVRDLSRKDKYLFAVIGILPVVTLGELVRRAPINVVWWIVAGGICYGLGAPFLRFSTSFRYSHAIWHTLVVVGSACHYVGVIRALATSANGM